jgi:hypothetical protein
MARILELIWGKWNRNISENPKKRLDTPVEKPPDGQITTRRQEHVPLVSRSQFAFVCAAEPGREPINPEWSGTSALVRIPDSSRALRRFRKVPTSDIAPLFDHLIGAAEQHRWQFEAERFRSLEIDAQLEFGRLVKRDISRISAFKNLIDEVGEAARNVR